SRSLVAHGRCHHCGKTSPFGSTFTKRRRGTERPHQCPDCGQCFRLSSTLITHQRRHGGEKPYQCPDCGKTFNVGSAFIQHQRLHGGGTNSDGSPCPCGVCGKSFPSSSSL
ncbi:ZN397 protein, partial [Nyctiprogne leucopyga]|nr:ZN397 protein [Nyctiprogne leucopyga]